MCSTNNTVDVCLSTPVFLYINIYKIYIILCLVISRFVSSFISIIIKSSEILSIFDFYHEPENMYWS